MEIVDVKPDTIEPEPYGVTIPHEEQTVFDTYVYLKKNGIIIFGMGPSTKGDGIKVKDLKNKFVGRKAFLEISIIQDGEIYHITKEEKIIAQYPPKNYIEGIITKLFEREMTSAESKKKIIDCFIDCGLPIRTGILHGNYKIGDWIHIDGWLLFDNLQIE